MVGLAGTHVRRAWKKVVGIAAPTISGYPMVAIAVTSLHGVSLCQVTLCRRSIG